MRVVHMARGQQQQQQASAQLHRQQCTGQQQRARHPQHCSGGPQQQHHDRSRQRQWHPLRGSRIDDLSGCVQMARHRLRQACGGRRQFQQQGNHQYIREQLAPGGAQQTMQTRRTRQTPHRQTKAIQHRHRTQRRQQQAENNGGPRLRRRVLADQGDNAATHQQGQCHHQQMVAAQPSGLRAVVQHVSVVADHSKLP
ncbi:hypothetical protein D3C72_1361650 [compost metagenome]